mmetsp:Transcript_4649/g.10845  ORF Transcript_4649/g.10845 Transcript_4649/m.10845 type:complete len:203 (-) Transcript_4649:147-755(-)
MTLCKASCTLAFSARNSVMEASNAAAWSSCLLRSFSRSRLSPLTSDSIAVFLRRNSSLSTATLADIGAARLGFCCFCCCCSSVCCCCRRIASERTSSTAPNRNSCWCRRASRSAWRPATATQRARSCWPHRSSTSLRSVARCRLNSVPTCTARWSRAIFRACRYLSSAARESDGPSFTSPCSDTFTAWAALACFSSFSSNAS